VADVAENKVLGVGRDTPRQLQLRVQSESVDVHKEGATDSARMITCCRSSTPQHGTCTRLIEVPTDKCTIFDSSLRSSHSAP
jgi:hypothetical protein